jgi:hypothetical protein
MVSGEGSVVKGKTDAHQSNGRKLGIGGGIPLRSGKVISNIR